LRGHPRPAPDTRSEAPLAVTALLEWYRSGEDVDGQIPALQGYLGHVSPQGTYWYYSDSRVIPIPAFLPA
jgi:hypothetical protein